MDDSFSWKIPVLLRRKKESSGTHSDTNLQVNGVDEGDIVKNDGNYLYVLNDDRVTIVDIRDKNMRKLSEIRPELTENDILCSYTWIMTGCMLSSRDGKHNRRRFSPTARRLTMIPVLSDVTKISLMNRTEM